MRRHDLTKKDLPTYLPTSLENTIQELVCQWHFHFSCIWAAVLFYTFDIYRSYSLDQTNFCPSFLTLIFYPYFLPSFLTIWKTVLETWHLRHWLQFWQLRTWIQTIILTWQLIVTLDSIRNSCDVYNNICHPARAEAEQHNLRSYRRPQNILESYRWARIYKISRQKMPYLQICATKMPYLPIFATKMPYSHIFVSKIFGSIDMWQYVWQEHLRTLLGLVLL